MVIGQTTRACFQQRSPHTVGFGWTEHDIAQVMRLEGTVRAEHAVVNVPLKEMDPDTYWNRESQISSRESLRMYLGNPYRYSGVQRWHFALAPQSRFAGSLTRAG